MWRFLEIRGPFLGVPSCKDFIVLGSRLGPPINGNYHVAKEFPFELSGILACQCRIQHFVEVGSRGAECVVGRAA